MLFCRDVSATQAKEARECGDEDVVAGRGPGQHGWYRWISRQVAGERVLDVGCGLGYGLDILRTAARDVKGQDLDPRLKRHDIYIGPLADLPDDSAEVVVSVDVVEHIENDTEFVRQLARLATRRIVLTTPNWTAGRGVWPYHVREYTPDALRSLCEPFGRVQLWKGTPDGERVFPIVHPAANALFNRGRAHPIVSSTARLLNWIVPEPMKIHSHLAAVITLGK